jgi:hypothetical protein
MERIMLDICVVIWESIEQSYLLPPAVRMGDMVGTLDAIA